MSIKVGYINILESADSVTLNVADATGYPSYRLYDRIVNTNWASGSTATSKHTIIVDQGSSGISDCDTLVVPSGHNLNGDDLEWEYSDDNVTYTDAVTNWTQSDALIIVKQSTGVFNKRYLKFSIGDFSSAPQMPELFITLLETLEAVPSYGLTKKQTRFVSRNETQSGKVSFVYKGSTKREYHYTLAMANPYDKAILEGLEEECGMVKPFYFEDHEGNQMMAELLEPINYAPTMSNMRGYALLIDYAGSYLVDYTSIRNYCRSQSASQQVVYRIDLKIMEAL